MINEKQIRIFLEEIQEELDFFIVDIHTENTIRVFIDNPQGITIETCAKISRFLEGKLDEAGINLNMEVSSPGIDMPLKVKEQFAKTIGKKVSVKFENGQKLIGILKAADEKYIDLEFEEKVKIPGKKKKSSEIKVQNFDRTEIIEVKRIISF